MEHSLKSMIHKKFLTCLWNKKKYFFHKYCHSIPAINALCGYPLVKVPVEKVCSFAPILLRFDYFRQNIWRLFFAQFHVTSRRAKRAGRPAGVLRRRLLHRNGNFVPLAPWTRTRRRVKMGFRRKTGRSRAVYESIRKIPTGKTTEISVASQPSIRFFPLMARNGPFRPFFGP